MTKLGVARIAGELGLAGGTITGGCCAAKYSKGMTKLNARVTTLTSEKEALKAHKTTFSAATKKTATTYFRLGKYLLENTKNNIKELGTEFTDAHSCLYKFVQDGKEPDCVEDKMTKLNSKLQDKGITSI